MQPIVTPEEMAAIDAAAPEPVEVLIGRAGAAVAGAAVRMLGGTYGKRVVVIAGKGNNGNDGRAAARRLRRRGVRVDVRDAGAVAEGEALPRCDLVIDAAYGTGFRDEYGAPEPGSAPVLSVDIPSGVDGSTGEAGKGAVVADRTVTFAALKPGLLLHPGRTLAGEVEVADIGLDCSSARAHLVTARDVAAWLPDRPAAAHKWQAATWLIGGSPGMAGALGLAARGAQRAGAGYVRASTPGHRSPEPAAAEVVGHALPRSGWARRVLDGSARFAAIGVGPGIGREPSTAAEVASLVRCSPVPCVVDGDGLFALANEGADALPAGTVLTPHDGEYERLVGREPGADRFAAARALAASTQAVVLLKGPTTIVADPHGQALVVTEGDARLATAGTGDVLTGIIAALLAQGLDPLRAAAAAAWWHARAARLGPARGLVAADVAELLPRVAAELVLAPQ